MGKRRGGDRWRRNIPGHGVEWRIMSVLWSRGPSTVAEICQDIWCEDGRRTRVYVDHVFYRYLLPKKIAGRRRIPNARRGYDLQWIYHAIMGKEETIQNWLQALADNLCFGDLKELDRLLHDNCMKMVEKERDNPDG